MSMGTEDKPKRGRPPHKRCPCHGKHANSCTEFIKKTFPHLASTNTAYAPFSRCGKHDLPWKSCLECTKLLNGDPDAAVDVPYEQVVPVLDLAMETIVYPVGVPDVMETDRQTGILKLPYTRRGHARGVDTATKDTLCAVSAGEASCFRDTMGLWTVAYDELFVLVIRITTLLIEFAPAGETAEGMYARRRRDGVSRIASYVSGKPKPCNGHIAGAIGPFDIVYRYANTAEVRQMLASEIIGAFCLRCVRRRRLLECARRMRAADLPRVANNMALLQFAGDGLQRARHIVGGVFTPITPTDGVKRRRVSLPDDSVLFGTFTSPRTLGVPSSTRVVVFPRFKGDPRLKLRLTANTMGRDTPFPAAVAVHSVFSLAGRWHVIVAVSADLRTVTFQPPTAVPRIRHRVTFIVRGDKQVPCFANGLGEPSVAFQVYPRPPWSGGTVHGYVNALAVQKGLG